MGSLRVGHNWATSLSPFTFMHWRRKWQPTPCSCLENPRDGGAWWAAIYRVAQSRTWLKQLSSSSSGSVKMPLVAWWELHWIYRLFWVVTYFHYTDSSDPWTWYISPSICHLWFLSSVFWRKWQPTSVFLPGKSHGRWNLVGYSPWGHKESDTTEWLHIYRFFVSLGRFIPKYFILFVAMVNGIVSLISLSVSWITFLKMLCIRHM